jgi:hypothetical protein
VVGMVVSVIVCRMFLWHFGTHKMSINSNLIFVNFLWTNFTTKKSSDNIKSVEKY